MDHYGGAVDNWNRELIMLSGSPWHLASSKRYLPGETEYPGNPLAHLFAENYPGRKLLLLVDKFEKAPWNAFSAALKGLRKEVEAGKLPSFGGVVCVGNSELGELAKGWDSPFTTDKIFGQTQLSFTWRKPASSRISGDIKHWESLGDHVHGLTGGHPGLTSFYARYLVDDYLGHTERTKWIEVEADIIKELARCLSCFFETNYRFDLDLDITTDFLRRIQQKYKADNGWDIPMRPGDSSSVDITTLLVPLIQGVDPKHVFSGGTEPHKQNLLFGWCGALNPRTFHRKPRWSAEISVGRRSRQVLDFLLVGPRLGEEGAGAAKEQHLVGLQVAINGNRDQLLKLASDNTMQINNELDQFAVVNFRTKGQAAEVDGLPFEAEGVDKHGLPLTVPIYQVSWDAVITDVRLYHNVTKSHEREEVLIIGSR